MQPRARLPAKARKGEVVEIRTLIDHPMETGLRRDERGRPVPRDMLVGFEARANGEVIFSADLRNGTSPNPALNFFARIDATTDFEFVWTHESGQTVKTTGRVTVG